MNIYIYWVPVILNNIWSNWLICSRAVTPIMSRSIITENKCVNNTTWKEASWPAPVHRPVERLDAAASRYMLYLFSHSATATSWSHYSPFRHKEPKHETAHAVLAKVGMWLFKSLQIFLKRPLSHNITPGSDSGQF